MSELRHLAETIEKHFVKFASLDLPGVVRRFLDEAGVQVVTTIAACTHCDDGWFSHRRDADTGRQAGVIVRTGDAA